jgi:tetratricopeptide (TPR) repeat protein
MKYSQFAVLALCCALIVQPVFAEQKKKPTPEELLNPSTEAVAPVDCVKTYDDILAADAANLAALNGRGMCKNVTESGSGDADLQKAIELATLQIEKDKNNAAAYYGRAMSYRVLKEYKKAREDYLKAIELNPDDKLWTGDLKTLDMEMQLQAEIKAEAPPAQ